MTEELASARSSGAVNDAQSSPTAVNVGVLVPPPWECAEGQSVPIVYAAEVADATASRGSVK